MSKAFTKEDDDVPVAPVRRRRVPVPSGAPNYMTAAGARRFRAELAHHGAGPTDDGDDVRVQELAEHLASAQVVEPELAADRVRFGAAVTVEDDEGNRVRYRIVGALEAEPAAHAISWQAPLAVALLGKKIGDLVRLPKAGEVEIVAIAPA